MKLAVISSAAIPSPPENYAGLEMLSAECSLEFARAGHDVTLVSAKGSPWAQSSPHKNLQVLETTPPDWSAEAEAKHHLAYRDLIHQEYAKGDTIVWDNTWFIYNYLIQQSQKDMKLIHTHHGYTGFSTAPPVRWPRFMGVSKAHALLLSNHLKIPVRHVHNGIRLPQEYHAPKGEYLLSLNRISPEKGIHDAIDVAMATRTPIKVVGDDTYVSDHQYVRRIIDRCDDSNGMAEYYGLVDNETKHEMLKNCLAVIATPSPDWLEPFGLFAVEGLAYSKPILCTKNGGLMEIVQHNRSGYLAGTPEELKECVSRIDDIKPEACRARAEEFSIEKMAAAYLRLFEKVINTGEKW